MEQINKNTWPYRFRAWHENQKTMHYNLEWMQRGFIDGVGAKFIYQSDRFKIDWSLPLEDQISDFPRLFIMPQIFWLKDKNGKDVYMSDIMLVEDGDDRFIGEVNYGYAGYAICVDMNDYKHACYFDKKGATFEVIGNTWENPEFGNIEDRRKIIYHNG